MGGGIVIIREVNYINYYGVDSHNYWGRVVGVDYLFRGLSYQGRYHIRGSS